MGDASRGVFLPGKQYQLKEWIVRSSSAVQAGDTLAHAVQRNVLETSPVSDVAVATKPPVQHKRPSLKRRTPKAESQESGSQTAVAVGSSNASSSSVVPIVSPASGILRIVESNVENDLRIGTVSLCSHPAIIGGLCAVCGQSAGPIGSASQQPQESSSMVSSQPAMSQVTVSGGITMTVSEKEAQQMSFQSMQKLKEHRKLSLVLDLDHTLVHATADARAQTHVGRGDVRTLLLPTTEIPGPNTQWMLHYIKLRPHVKEFFEQVSTLYEISVYTAGTRSYAEQITMVLSRCVVGTTMDDGEIQQLRLQVARVRQELERKQDAVEQTSVGENKDECTDDVSGVADGDVKMTDDVDIDGAPTESSNTTRKRKRVTFGEVNSESRTDEATEADLTRFEQELEEAERLDKQALALRQKLFGSRIVSRTDVSDLGRDVKSLKRVFPCGGTMAVILDDREDVWANAEDFNEAPRGEPPQNLLFVRPYHWKPFLGFADVNNAAGQDLSETRQDKSDSNADEGESDDQLRWSVDTLRRIHGRFYRSKKDSSFVPVAQLVQKMRKDVLKGCRLVLSGLVPLHKQNRGLTTPRPPAVRYAETLGAVVSDNVTTTTTHVVATRDGTDKTNLARKIPGCAIVKASWLMECYWRIQLCNVTQHLLATPKPSTLRISPVKTSEIASANKEDSNSDSDDDDLAAELEAEMLG